ncbi:unnamed protein product [Rhizophagus irregularis]|nr:unnamed protein product [Rhizophagus irregularis]CAB5372732.1 unnamed protein product [Rhizophagus irregularis]
MSRYKKKITVPLQRRTSASGRVPLFRTINPPSATYSPIYYEPESWQYRVAENLIKGKGYNEIGSYLKYDKSNSPVISPTILNIEEYKIQNRTSPNVEDSNSQIPATPNDLNLNNISREFVAPLLPLKKAKINNVDILVQESDDKRASQASSGGSWPSWTYVYYSPPSDSNRDNLLQDRTDDSDIIIPDPLTSAAAGVGSPDDNNNSSRKSNSQKSPWSRSKTSFPSIKRLSTTSFYTLPQRALYYVQEPFIVCPFGSVLFTMGFLFAPLWWFGSIFPRHPKTTADFQWKRYNQLMSIFSFFLIAGILGIIIWYLRYYKESNWYNNI